MLYTIVLGLLHHLFTCICPSIYYYCHILITCTHTYIHLILPALLHYCYATSSPNPVFYANLTYPVAYLSFISITVAIEHHIRHSPAHTYTSPPPGDLYKPIAATVHNVSCILYILPPSLSTPTPSSRTPMAAIIAFYSVYAHYHQRVGMYVCGKRVSQFFTLSDSFLWPHRLRPCCPR